MIMKNFAYFPHTREDIDFMLKRIGIKNVEELYSDVPRKFIHDGYLNLPEAMSESEVRAYFEKIAKKNTSLKMFVGQGAYDHYTPSVINYIISRSEYLTAYTPYQAEISQGTLRYIFEYQSVISDLTGLDVSNASMYDGATAAAEAAKMCVAATKKRNTVLLSSTLLSNVSAVVESYAKFGGFNVKFIKSSDGITDFASLKTLLEEGDVAGVLVPAINKYGIIEDFTGYSELIHEYGALVAEYCDPSALAVLKSPGEWGFDITVGDGQSLGIPLLFGGPYVGFMSCKKELLRKMPGRIVGQTTDADGKRCFVLTLQAREQHIKRDKATSNICSNQSLMALFVTVYSSLMGEDGLKNVNDLSYGGAHYLYEELLKTGKFEKVFDKPFLKEFVLKPLIDAEKLGKKLLESGFFAAMPTEEGYVSFCVTEKRTKEEIDELISVIKEVKP